MQSDALAGCGPVDIDCRNATADDLVDIGRRTGRRTLTIGGLLASASALPEAYNLVASDEAVEESAALLGTSDLPHLHVSVVLHRSTPRGAHRGRSHRPRDPTAVQTRCVRPGQLVRRGTLADPPRPEPSSSPRAIPATTPRPRTRGRRLPALHRHARTAASRRRHRRTTTAPVRARSHETSRASAATSCGASRRRSSARSPRRPATRQQRLNSRRCSAVSPDASPPTPS